MKSIADYLIFRVALFLVVCLISVGVFIVYIYPQFEGIYNLNRFQILILFFIFSFIIHYGFAIVDNKFISTLAYFFEYLIFTAATLIALVLWIVRYFIFDNLSVNYHSFLWIACIMLFFEIFFYFKKLKEEEFIV